MKGIYHDWQYVSRGLSEGAGERRNESEGLNEGLSFPRWVVGLPSLMAPPVKRVPEKEDSWVVSLRDRQFPYHPIPQSRTKSPLPPQATNSEKHLSKNLSLSAMSGQNNNSSCPPPQIVFINHGSCWATFCMFASGGFADIPT